MHSLNRETHAEHVISVFCVGPLFPAFLDPLWSKFEQKWSIFMKIMAFWAIPHKILHILCMYLAVYICAN